MAAKPMGVEQSDFANAIGAPRTIGARAVIVKSAVELTKTEEQLLSTRTLTVEDDPFKNLPEANRPQLLLPTYDPVHLYVVSQTNNTLEQCVAAMEVNIDGTGYDIEKKKAKKDEKVDENDSTVKSLRDFFDNPYPNVSFTSIRRKLRRDLEITGNAYLEVLRDTDKKIAFVNYMDAKLTRMMVLDDPVVVEKKVMRNGKEVTVKMMVRERRYAQWIGNTRVRYFKEFGATRRLDSTTGFWEGDIKAKAINDENTASEVIHFKLNNDVLTMYGVPRWINQIPSVLGSRKAEEFNLDFFNHGGLPPVMIMIQGGQLSSEARDALTKYLSGEAKTKQRAVIAEVFATSGDLSQAGQVKVSVERFGSEKQSDSMFEKYDERCHLRTRGSFRLPPLFVGLAQDYTYATAYTAYIVAEAQVFKPEREGFDETINVTLMKELAPEYKYRSKPLQVHDIKDQLQAMSLMSGTVDQEELVDEVNEKFGLQLKYKKPELEPLVDEETGEVIEPKRPSEKDEGKKKQSEGVVKVLVSKRGKIKKIDDEVLVSLADDWAAWISGDRIFEPESVRTMSLLVKNLSAPTKRLFNSYVGQRMINAKHDPSGVADLLNCAVESLHGRQA